MNTPDITPVQAGSVGAFAAAIASLAAAGVSELVLLAFIAAGTAIVIALVIADAVIRRGRAGIAQAEAYVADVRQPAPDEVLDEEPDDGFGAVSTGGAHDAVSTAAEAVDAKAGA